MLLHELEIKRFVAASFRPDDAHRKLFFRRRPPICPRHREQDCQVLEASALADRPITRLQAQSADNQIYRVPSYLLWVTLELPSHSLLDGESNAEDLKLIPVTFVGSQFR